MHGRAGDGAAGGFEIRHAGPAGRLRLGAATLRGRARACRRLEAALGRDAAFRAFEVRPLTGSVILRFDPEAAREDVLARAARALEAALGEDADPGGEAGGEAERGNGASGATWHALEREAVAERLEVDPERGLDAAAVEARRAAWGPNAAETEDRPGPMALIRKQFESLPVLLLIGSAAVSVASGGGLDAAATLSVVAVNAAIGVVTEGQAERTIAAIAGTGEDDVAVLREGARRTVASRELVPGDVVRLRPGMRTPADLRILAAEDLKADESHLTGESRPAAKRGAPPDAPGAPPGERATVLHAGAAVVQGRGRGLVVATGGRTEAGRLRRLSAATKRPRAPTEAELDALGARLAVGALAACGLFVAAGLARGRPLATLLRDALALAVAAVPEGLPMVATTTLSLGLRRMERRGVAIRRLGAVEALGAVQVLCLDKTGTVTLNRMQVTAAAAGTREVALDDAEALEPVLVGAALNSDVTLEEGRPADGSRTERALADFALSADLDVEAMRRERPRRRTLRRRQDRPWMATLHDGEGPELLLKGSPEAVLERCTRLREDGRTREMTEDDREAALALNDDFAARPARVLAFAEGPAGEEDAPEELTFTGLLALSDPVRPEAVELVARLHRAGLRTVLITGDQAATAEAVARELALSGDVPLGVVDAVELGDTEPGRLAELARRSHVFARVASDRKLAIVQALQADGAVVAMTGDGENDGPALAAADVGIAMGREGAELARDVANVVIRDDDLATLVDAVAQGRAIHRNIRRSLEFLVTTNLSEILVSLVEAVHGPNELETPMELLWINLVTDVLPGLGLALADPDEELMTRPPRPRGEGVVPPGDWWRMGGDSALIATSALAAHFVGLARHGPGPATRGMTFLALSQGQLLYTLAAQRRDARRLRPWALFGNPRLDLALVGSSALAALPFFVPPLRRVLGVARLGGADLAVAFAAAATPLATVLARGALARSLDPPRGGGDAEGSGAGGARARRSREAPA